MVKEQRKTFFLIHIFSDALLLFLAFCGSLILTTWVKGSQDQAFGVLSILTSFFHNLSSGYLSHLNLFKYIFVLPLLTAWVTRRYRYDIFVRTGNIVKKIIYLHVVLIITFNVITILFLPSDNLGLFGNSLLSMTCALYILNRYVFNIIIKNIYKDSNFISHVLIAGDEKNATACADIIKQYPEWGIRVAGFLFQTGEREGDIIENIRVLGGVNDLPMIFNERIIDVVILADNENVLYDNRFVELRCDIEGVSCISSENFFSNSPVPADHFMKSRSEMLIIKRLIDLLVSAGCIVFFLPLWLIIPVLIKKDSKGPVFFKQTRVGKNGRHFIIYKFRSMVEHAEEIKADLLHLNEMDGPAFKIKEDPRQTRVGNFLRKSSLDELPQLFNVLKGDISLVGPRPPIQEEVDHYRPWEKKKLSVMQGISCLWQISGRNEIKFDEWMKLDLMYIEYQSLPLDFVIMMKTIPAVISRKGAG